MSSTFKPRRTNLKALPEAEEETEGGALCAIERINLRVTRVERDRFTLAARAKGLNLSAWLRLLAHEALVVVEREMDIAKGRRARAEKALHDAGKGERYKAVELAEKIARAKRTEAREEARDRALARGGSDDI
jgi:hypothetical protein